MARSTRASASGEFQAWAARRMAASMSQARRADGQTEDGPCAARRLPRRTLASQPARPPVGPSVRPACGLRRRQRHPGDRSHRHPALAAASGRQVFVLESWGTAPNDTVVTWAAADQRVIVLRRAPPDNNLFGRIVFPPGSVVPRSGDSATVRVRDDARALRRGRDHRGRGEAGRADRLQLRAFTSRPRPRRARCTAPRSASSGSSAWDASTPTARSSSSTATGPAPIC